jgi:hypothetical protein
MKSLAETLASVRDRIAQYQGKDVNEQDTKTAFIDPVLRALGWDVGNLAEVRQEYKVMPRDNPVDYALFLSGVRQLFVEAKALRQNLEDRKWTVQTVNYGNTAGVRWTVITNGDEYRIYNACVGVPLEEKLFRSIRISDPSSSPEDTLALLSKDRIADFESIWELHNTDHHVQAVLGQVFSPRPHPVLMRLVKRLVKERIKTASSKAIRESLARVCARLGFPAETAISSPRPSAGERAQQSPGSERARKAWETRRKNGGAMAQKRSTLKEIIDAGILNPPVKLTRRFKDSDLEAELQADGSVCFRGKAYKTLSAAGGAAITAVSGRPVAGADGWKFWQFADKSGNRVPLDIARQEYLKRTTS